MANDSDACVPKALNDFVFDLYDSVTLSQIPEEQNKLYQSDFRDLSSKYFANHPWPSPQSIASECNGHPLFLAVYRELTHRHWHSVTRPSIRDRIDGWQVYRELFEEILDADDPNFYLLTSWTFDILHEFVYQFQGFCQIRSAVFSSARKHGLLHSDGSVQTANSQNANLAENLNTLLNAKDAWDVETVLSYLHRLIHMGFPRTKEGRSSSTPIPPVYSYLSVFSAVVLSRLECLLADYTSSLQALTPLHVHEGYVIVKGEEKTTVGEILQAVVPARLSLAYHAGVSFLMLRRYKDATKVLGDICGYMQRGFKTGQLRKIPGSDQFNKQYDRMLSLLAVLIHICPAHGGAVDEGVLRTIREKHGAKLEAATSYEEWFMSPKFVSADPTNGVYRQQIQLFLREMKSQPTGRTLRSYLKLYTGLPVEKLAKFHDLTVEDFIPILLAYKVRMLQMERGEEDDYAGGSAKMALDIHYYLVGDTVHVDEAEIQRRFENYFVAQITQNSEIRRDAAAIDTVV